MSNAISQPIPRSLSAATDIRSERRRCESADRHANHSGVNAHHVRSHGKHATDGNTNYGNAHYHGVRPHGIYPANRYTVNAGPNADGLHSHGKCPPTSYANCGNADADHVRTNRISNGESSGNTCHTRSIAYGVRPDCLSTKAMHTDNSGPIAYDLCPNGVCAEAMHAHNGIADADTVRAYGPIGNGSNTRCIGVDFGEVCANGCRNKTLYAGCLAVVYLGLRSKRGHQYFRPQTPSHPNLY